LPPSLARHGATSGAAGERVAARIERVLKQHGRYLDAQDANDEPDVLALTEPALSACYAATAGGQQMFGDAAGRPALRMLTAPESHKRASSSLCAQVRGINIHASAPVPGTDRPRLERLCDHVHGSRRHSCRCGRQSVERNRADGLLLAWHWLYSGELGGNSGGLTFPAQWQIAYTPPLISIHGENDMVIVNFKTTGMTADIAFKGRGGFVINCNHGGGHCGGAALAPSIWTFFKAHPYGVDPNPCSRRASISPA
jgi:hypothetical protein